MPIQVKCSCGKTLNAPDTLAGKRAKCPGCGQIVQIPGAAAPAGAKPAAPKPPAPKAPAAPAPKAKAPAAKPAAKPAPKPENPITTFAKKEDTEDLHPHASCPNCNAFVSKKDALCIQCGMNLVTGKLLTTVRSKEPTGPAKGIALLYLVLNLGPLPGLGTLIGAPKDDKLTGVWQALLGLAGWAGWLFMPDMVAEKLNLVPGGSTLLSTAAYLGGAGWGLASALAILKDAKPAEGADGDEEEA